jgi:hypothetical protein
MLSVERDMVRQVTDKVNPSIPNVRRLSIPASLMGP